MSLKTSPRDRATDSPYPNHLHWPARVASGSSRSTRRRLEWRHRAVLRGRFAVRVRRAWLPQQCCGSVGSLAFLRQEQRPYNFARADPLDHMRHAAIGDDSHATSLRRNARGFELAQHSPSSASILALRERQHLIADASDLGEELRAVAARLGGVKSVHIREQEQKVSVNVSHHQRREFVIVAEYSLPLGRVRRMVEFSS